MTYKFAWKEENTALYIDAFDCKHAAKNGNLAWRINNPGLVKHHCRFAKKNGSIGVWGKFAIFSNPLQGHQALKEWLHSKTMLQSNLYNIGKHYQSAFPEQFTQNLASSSGIPPKTKLKDLTQTEFENLVTSIEKLCGFIRVGNEELLLLPKMAARIERPGKEDLYLVGKDLTLTQDEAMSWIISHRLDGVIVHHANGDIHLRSRPRYRTQILKLPREQPYEGAEGLAVLARLVGEKIMGQCVWGFINGIKNTKEEAIESSNLISSKAENEQVISLRNDQVFKGAKEISVAVLLKMGIDTPIVKNAVQFLRYLLSLAENKENNSPVIIFAHSQGAAIAEHALTLLSSDEKQKIRVFTFGGWSFIAPGLAHPESHNYASVGDLIPRIGSLNLQYLALRKYEGLKEGLSPEQIIQRLAFGDAIHDLDCLNPHILEKYTQSRCEYYANEFKKISNITVLDSKNLWEHSFNNESYQAIVHSIIDRYRKNRMNVQLANTQNILIESFV
jgi:hypothetical protein